MKEVDSGEPVLAPPKRPRRETSCSQSHAEVNHAARCFAPMPTTTCAQQLHISTPARLESIRTGEIMHSM